VLDDFSPAKATVCLRNLANPAPVLELSARRPGTLQPWIAWLERQLAEVRGARRHAAAGHDPLHHHHAPGE
jgi:hydrogenase nickel incorporation protein HypB